MRALALGHVLVVLVGYPDRAIFAASGATGAFVLIDESGLSDQGHFEVPGFPLDSIYLRVRQDVDVRMAAAFYELGRLDTHGTVVSGKGLIELGHLAADSRHLVYEEDFEALVGEIESGLDPADTGSDHHNVANVVCGILYILSSFFFHDVHP